MLNMRKRVIYLIFVFTLGMAWGSKLFVYSPTAKVTSVHGNVMLLRDGKSTSLSADTMLSEMDTVRTGKRSSATLELQSGEQVTVPPDSELTLWVFFHSPKAVEAVKSKTEDNPTGLLKVFSKIGKEGIDFEDESSNTLACSRG